MTRTQRLKIKLANLRYYQEMALSQKEREKRADVATKTEIELVDLFMDMSSAYQKSLDDFVENYGNFSDGLNIIYNKAEDELMTAAETPFAEEFLKLQKANFGLILVTTLSRLRQKEADLNREIEDFITDTSLIWLFSVNRAGIDARNLVNSLGNCNQLVELQQQGYKNKQWCTIMDGRERMTHAAANGQTVPINQPFYIGGYPMMFPRDDSGGAPINEIINCRCTMRGV